MNESQKLLLEKNMSRYDTYINAVNTKAAFLVTFNTFVLGTLLLGQKNILSGFSDVKLSCWAVSFFLICLISIAVAITLSFLAVNPFLKSGTQSESYKTMLFFKSVADMGIDEYKNRIQQIDDVQLLNDLICQTHVLAKGATQKFHTIQKATYVTVGGTILMLLLSAVLHVIDWLTL